ncbi:Ubiquitin thioesterase trabid [Operophtera brumata]|uniref:Ubiquitin thioesterase trabid n=1 Tax=Operophtera brumata TaxID=104452 RepID=A0A0L7KQS5_OPEBR|nr:Ubiquitin thioesterase trabid [Operophtera brumata]
MNGPSDVCVYVCVAAPDIARGIRSHVAGCVRYKKGSFPCRFLNEFCTFSLPCGSRLYALWNRSAGDCLPDAVCQAAYGVFDRDNTLRAALGATLQHAARGFLARWMAWERLQAQRLDYVPEESQLRAEWARLVAAAPEPGTPLHQVRTLHDTAPEWTYTRAR